jgi:hypothetical protein
MRLDRADVDAVADHKQAAGARWQLVEPGDHLHQLCGGNLRGSVVQLFFVDIGDGTVRGLDNRQSRGSGLHEEHRGALVSHCPAHKLSQSCRGQKRGHQHDVLNLVGGQRVAQGRRFELVGTCHADGGQLKARTDRIFAGTQDGGHHSIGRADSG